VRLWTELAPWERRARLASVHPELTEDALVAAGLAVPELAPQISGQESWEGKVMVVLRYFGDEGNPQPERGGGKRVPLLFDLMDPGAPGRNAHLLRPAPDWGRLPPPEKEHAKEDDLVGGLPYRKADYEAAGKLYRARKMTVEGIETRTSLSTRRAYRIYRQYEAAAVIYGDGGLRPGVGYRWDPAFRDDDAPGYRLIRG